MSVRKKPKLHPPDFTATCGHFGGKLADLSRPLVRRYGPHSPALWPVTLTITSWVNTSALGAKHVYAVLEPEKNPLWDAKENHWRQCWDDKEGEWRDWGAQQELRYKCLYRHDYKKLITKWVKKMVAKYFPPDKYLIRDDNYDQVDLKKWAYKGFGD